MEKEVCGGAKPGMDVGDMKGDPLGGRLGGVGADEDG